MKAHSNDVRNKVLELLKSNRSHTEISKRTGIPAGTVEDWAAGWRKTGDLNTYKRAGSEFTNKAKILSNGYYPVLRKRYLGMKWTDKKENREFGFANPVEAIHYYLDNGTPRPCIYCGLYPPKGKVWGLDRIDSNIGHIPGNLVPCCSYNDESPYLSCQTSKSKFTLFGWLKSSMSRINGKQVDDRTVIERINDIKLFAENLKNANKLHS